MKNSNFSAKCMTHPMGQSLAGVCMLGRFFLKARKNGAAVIPSNGISNLAPVAPQFFMQKLYRSTQKLCRSTQKLCPRRQESSCLPT